MNLIKFLLCGAIIAGVFGELGHFPFGGSKSGAVYFSDILLGLMLISAAVWKVSVKNRIFIPGIFKWMILFLGVGILSLLWSLHSLPVLETARGSLYLVRFILYSSVLVVVFNLRKAGVLSRESLVSLWIRVGVVVAGLGLLQLALLPNFNSSSIFLSDFGFDPHQGRLASTFLDPNFVGVYLSLTLGLALYRLTTAPSKRWWVVVSLLTGAILLTLSRSAYLMAAVVGGVLVFSSGRRLTFKKKLAAGVLGVVLGLVILLVRPQVYERLWGGLTIDTSASQRFESWKKGLAVFQANPFLGVGFNNLRSTFNRSNLVKVYSPDGGHAGAGVDSSLLTVLATTGLLGGFIYIVFWWQAGQILAADKQKLSRTVLFSLIGLMLASQFINALFFTPIMLWYFSILGAVIED